MHRITFSNSEWIQVAPTIFHQVFIIRLPLLAKPNSSRLSARGWYRISSPATNAWQKDSLSLLFLRLTSAVAVCNSEQDGIPFISKMADCMQQRLTRDMFPGRRAMKKMN